MARASIRVGSFSIMEDEMLLQIHIIMGGPSENSVHTVKESPHPHVPVALGLVSWKSEPIISIL